MEAIISVKFKDWGKQYTFDADGLELKERDKIIVETEEGLVLGTVKGKPLVLNDDLNKSALKKVIRKANEEDLMQFERNREKEASSFKYCQDKIMEMKLNMKLVNVEYLFDGSKATFYFTAEERVDFRELVKDLAGKLHTRIELRQIGVRDEAKQKGGIGPCGRILCCTTWIDSFEPVSVKMAKKQGLSLNPSNISGMCGRLMCCLSYEYDNYLKGDVPHPSSKTDTAIGKETDVKAREVPVPVPAKERGKKEKEPFKKAEEKETKEREKKPQSEGEAKKGRRRRRSRNKRKGGQNKGQ